MYWKEVPVQVQAQDERGQVSASLDPRFQQAVDAIAMIDGAADGEEYLASWEWGAFIETPGPAREAAIGVAVKYNSQFPRDIVAIVTERRRSGCCDPRPGALDHLMDDDLATRGMQ